jgi:phenylalanyl-tRNA synthetase alpha chain
MAARISADQLARDRAVRDLTDPAEGSHAIQLIVDRAVHALARLWGYEVRWCGGDRIVTIKDNYDNLGFDPLDVTRDARYTRYVDDRHMLRSHSTAMIPAALRALANDPAQDVLLVCPGIVYRRDAIDRLHTGTPHQLDLWRITRRAVRMTENDLDEMITVLLGSLLPASADRRETRVHPYTRRGRQIDVAHGGEWIEVAECGLAHPDVLARAGLGTSWSGLALGMGLDRMLMLIKAIPDIRLLRSTEPAIATQMFDLDRYRPVSMMPSIRRDISVAVNADNLAEDLGDRVRGALGGAADWVESVQILKETPCAVLPAQARARLGARPDQKNLLVQVILRDLERTLTDRDVNILRDRIYAAIHQGTGYQWATLPPRDMDRSGRQLPSAGRLDR